MASSTKGGRVEDSPSRRIRVEDAERRRIRVGVGGWTYEPWRDNFYPAGWPKTRELEYASRQLSAIEINATYHGTQRRTSFAKWRDETPDDFVFSVKASRYATNRRVLAEAGDSIARFVDSGIAELGPKLGPVVWQFATTKHFEADDFEAFLALLPKTIDGLALRHAVEPRHASFCVPAFVDLARKYGVAIVYADSPKYPAIADATADFVYCRLQDAQENVPTGYKPAALKKWAAAAKAWESGSTPKDMTLLAKPPAKRKRDVFIYMINGAKVRAPAAALAFLAAVKK